MTVNSIDPRTGEIAERVCEESTLEEVGQACKAAADAGAALGEAGRTGRAALLRGMAEALESAEAEIVTLANRETALGEQRLSGELARTCYQLRLFAEVVEEGSYLEIAIDHKGQTPMGPRPDLRRMLMPVGPVAVFGASNFPLAFSVPGGDTAAALAAGCPVVVKAHPSHPATSALCHRLLLRAALDNGLPAGVIQLVHGFDAGSALVQDALIKAVSFTGSLTGGKALIELIGRRFEPIPFFGELSSLNPIVVTPGAASARANEIADGLASSCLLGSGQFCTKPGLVFVPEGGDGDQLVASLSSLVAAAGPMPMLNEGISRGYQRGAQRLREYAEVIAAVPEPTEGTDGYLASPLLVQADADDITSEMIEEVFGPATLVARYRDLEQLTRALSRLPGSLAATIHAENDTGAEDLTRILTERAGRLLYNGFPTGVAVSWAQHHGGPWPSTNTLHTSVGATAIRRFQRPVVFQDAPPSVLPPELRDEATTVPRRIDGHIVLPHGYGS